MIISRKPSNTLKSRKGITLLETMAAVSVSAVMMVTVTQTLLTAQVESMRLADFTDMSVELRQTQLYFNADIFNSNSLLLASDTTLELTRRDTGELVRYSFDAATATLSRSVDGENTDLLDGITGFTFAYYYLGDARNSPRSAHNLRPERVHRVQLQATLERGLSTHNRETFDLTAGGVLRNRPIAQ